MITYRLSFSMKTYLGVQYGPRLHKIDSASIVFFASSAKNFVGYDFSCVVVISILA